MVVTFQRKIYALLLFCISLGLANVRNCNDSNQLNLKLSMELVMAKYIAMYTPDEYPVNTDFVSPLPLINNSSSIEEKIISILFLGDSINRIMVEDFCDRVGGKFTHNWGIGFHVLKKQRTSAMCKSLSNKIVIGFLHIFGSESVGPYYESVKSENTASDYTDTIIRIPQGIQQFRALIGFEIDFIFFRTELWDLAPHSNNSISLLPSNRKALIERFIENQILTINIIKELSPFSYIGTHTIPRIRNQQYLRLFDSYQNAIRLISHQTGLFLFDWNLQFYNIDPNSYLRDLNHPSYWYSSGFLIFIEKALRSWCCLNNTTLVNFN